MNPKDFSNRAGNWTLCIEFKTHSVNRKGVVIKEIRLTRNIVMTSNDVLTQYTTNDAGIRTSNTFEKSTEVITQSTSNTKAMNSSSLMTSSEITPLFTTKREEMQFGKHIIPEENSTKKYQIVVVILVVIIVLTFSVLSLKYVQLKQKNKELKDTIVKFHKTLPKGREEALIW